ncbi:MAG: hypothetical protein QXU87_06225 [Candidatus Caldarchaeum sp.]|uniref:Uncharacterized protein n=1 Tax=Caldiarchaeum subterraneum TaxID=311458 RepID=A0A7C5L9Y3_CALS0
MSADDALSEKLERILTGFKELRMLAKSSGNLGVERNVEHIISHIQTMLESLKKTEAGFSL